MFSTIGIWLLLVSVIILYYRKDILSKNGVKISWLITTFKEFFEFNRLVCSGTLKGCIYYWRIINFSPLIFFVLGAAFIAGGSYLEEKYGEFVRTQRVVVPSLETAAGEPDEDGFITMFDINNEVPLGEQLFGSLLLGMLEFFIVGLVLLSISIYLRKINKRIYILGKLSSLVVVMGLCGTLMTGAIVMSDRYESKKLRGHYQQGRCVTTEGIVKVLYEQNVNGHDSPDQVEINGGLFEINFFEVSPAYTFTIAHGGCLKDGAYARVYHYDGDILRVDIRK